VLTGILVSASGEELRMVATDSYRLSVKETRLEAPLEGAFEANVPARALQELNRIASQSGAEALSVAVRTNQVVFEAGGTVLSSRPRLADARREVGARPSAQRRGGRPTSDVTGVGRGDRDDDQQQPQREGPGHDALRAGAEPLGDRPRRPITLGPRARDAVRPPGDHDSTAATRRIAPPPVDRVGPPAGRHGVGRDGVGRHAVAACHTGVGPARHTVVGPARHTVAGATCRTVVGPACHAVIGPASHSGTARHAVVGPSYSGVAPTLGSRATRRGVAVRRGRPPRGRRRAIAQLR
jgi:hypothetical protein